MNLWKHQQSAHNFIFDRLKHGKKGILLEHGMGSGKTRTSIAFGHKMNAKKILIVTIKSVIPTWEIEYKKFFNDNLGDYEILALEKKSVKEKAATLKKFIEKNRRYNKKSVVVINYESLWRPGLGPTSISKGVILENYWDIVIMDECQKISSPKSTVSKFAAKLTNCSDIRIALSGTPCRSGLLDIFGTYRFLDKSIFGTNYTRFSARYGIFGGFENRMVVAYKNVEEYNQKYFTIAHRVKSEDVLDLPATIHIPIPVELNPKARKIYNQLDQEMRLEIQDQEVSPANALVKNLRLAQITSGILALDGGTQQMIDSAKVDALKELIESLPPKEPVVVFTRFKPEVTEIKKALTKLTYTNKEGEKINKKCVELTGDKNELAIWKQGNADVIIVNLQSGGAGVDLTRSKYCFFFSKNYSNSDYEQSLARLCRPGADIKSTIRYYHIYAKNTIDNIIMKAIQKKRKILDMIIENYQV